jgi:hypothetical protein
MSVKRGGLVQKRGRWTSIFERKKRVRRTSTFERKKKVMEAGERMENIRRQE